MFNDFVLLVDARDGREGLPKGFWIWILRQRPILTSTVGVVQSWIFGALGLQRHDSRVLSRHDRSTLELCALWA